MIKSVNLIKTLSDQDPGNNLFGLTCFGALIDRAEFEAWLAIKAEAHLLMRAVDDVFNPDELTERQTLADLCEVLAMAGQMRRSA